MRIERIKHLLKRAIIGPQQNAIMAHHSNIECWLGSFVIFKVIRTSIAKKPYSFVIFRGGGGGPDPCSLTPLDPRMIFCTTQSDRSSTNALLAAKGRKFPLSFSRQQLTYVISFFTFTLQVYNNIGLEHRLIQLGQKQTSLTVRMEKRKETKHAHDVTALDGCLSCFRGRITRVSVACCCHHTLATSCRDML